MRSDAWGATYAPGSARFPFVRRLGPAALIALNSAMPTRASRRSRRAWAPPIATLAEILAGTRREGLIRVVLIHHPPLPGQAPPRRALRDVARA